MAPVLTFFIIAGYLLISGAETVDTGRYACEVSNTAGKDVAIAKVIVTGIIRIPSDTYIRHNIWTIRSNVSTQGSRSGAQQNLQRIQYQACIHNCSPMH